MHHIHKGALRLIYDNYVHSLQVILETKNEKAMHKKRKRLAK